MDRWRSRRLLEIASSSTKVVLGPLSRNGLPGTNEYYAAGTVLPARNSLPDRNGYYSVETRASYY
eukprot:1373033-Amorphochlora_amoeboformis.AAC.1